MKNTILNTILLPVALLLFNSCSIISQHTGIGIENTNGNVNNRVITSGIINGQFRVQLVECTGNASSQNVTAIITVTNIGQNAKMWIGGSTDGTLAIDSYGITSKPQSGSGGLYDLPSGVTIRVEVKKIEPVRPDTPMFQILKINVGSERDNVVQFKNVPIVWTN